MILKCEKCGAINWVWNLPVYRGSDDQYCPCCKGTEFKKITGHEEHYTQAEMLGLWACFGDVSINDMDETEDQFLFFPAGTDRMEIWQWFDEKYPKGVYKLMEDVENEDRA